jgi:Arc/MetJ-type ribon-helix-helix transcriptional regulator
MEYNFWMVQLVTRVDDELARALDALVDSGSVLSRSDAVRRGLEQLIDQFKRVKIGEEIREGYVRQPQTEDEVAWSDAASIAMIAEEPW